MSYTSQSQIETLIPPADLTAILDDDRDGQPDSGLLDNIIAGASQAVDAYLAASYPMPLPNPAPAAAAEAALLFACEMCYARRLNQDQKNPFTSRANYWRERLAQIGRGEIPLDGSTGDVEDSAAYGGPNAIKTRLTA